MFNLFREKHHALFDNSKIRLIFSFRGESLSISFLDSFITGVDRETGVNFRNCRVHGTDPFRNQTSSFLSGNVQFKHRDSQEELLAGQPFHHCCPPDHIQLSLSPIHADLLLKSDQLNRVLTESNFNSLYVVNDAYQDLHNTVDIGSYRSYGVPIKSLAYKEIFTGMKEIDTSKNAGYSAVIKNSWLMAACKMWFRNSFINEISANLRDFPALRNQQQSSDITFIQLYEHMNEAHFKKSLAAQYAFRKWIGFEEIIRKDRDV